MSKNVSAILVGYHGKENFGDDIFRRVITKYLATQMGVSSCAISCGAGSKLNISNDIDSLTVTPFRNPLPRISRLRWLFIFIKALKADIIVFAAGSIFTHQEFHEIRFLLKLLKLLKGKKFKIVAFGVSIGPFPNNRKRSACAKALENFDTILLRDQESISELNAMGVQTNIHIGNDLALLFSVEKYRQNQLSKNNTVLGISLTPRAFPGNQDEIDDKNFVKLGESITSALRNNDTLSIIIMSFCSDKMDGDTEISERFLAKLKPWKERVELVLYSDRDFDSFMYKLYSCDALIASRMHAGILAIMGAIPILQLAYARKIYDFYTHQQLGTNWLMATENFERTRVDKFISTIGSVELSEYFVHQRTKLTEKANLLNHELENLMCI